MREGAKTKIEVIPRCSRCEESLEYTSCTECRTPLIQQFPPDGNIIYCYGPKGENWHMCEPCHIYLENLKCPKCGIKQISRYAKDTKKGVMIVNTCRDCESTWETKRGGKSADKIGRNY